MANTQKPVDLATDNIKYEDLQKLRELSARINKGEPFDSAAFNQLFVRDTAKFLQNLAISQVALPLQGHLPVLPKEVVEMDDILTQQVISTYQQEIKPLLILTGKN